MPATFGSDSPRDDGTGLVDVHAPVYMSGNFTEQHELAGSHGGVSGTIEGSGHELWFDLAIAAIQEGVRNPGRSENSLLSYGTLDDGAREDAEPRATGAGGPTNETRRERVLVEPVIMPGCLDCLEISRRRWRYEVELGGAPLRNEVPALAKLDQGLGELRELQPPPR